MKPVELLFFNVSRKRIDAWISYGERQGIVRDVHFIQKREQAERWEESITIDGKCNGFYDLKLFLSNCRWDRTHNGCMVKLSGIPPFFR